MGSGRRAPKPERLFVLGTLPPILARFRPVLFTRSPRLARFRRWLFTRSSMAERLCALGTLPPISARPVTLGTCAFTRAFLNKIMVNIKAFL